MPSPKPRKTSTRPETRAQASSKFVSSILLMLLVWLIAELVFLPLAAESFTGEVSKRVTSLVAVAFVIAIGSLLPQTIGRSSQVVELASRSLVRSRYPKERQAKMQPVFEGVGWALLVTVLGIIFSSLVYWVNAVFGGMTLFATIVAVSILLLQAASSWSQEL